MFAAEELTRYASEDLRFTKQEQDWGGCGELAPSCGNRTPGPGDGSWKGPRMEAVTVMRTDLTFYVWISTRKALFK